MPLLAKTLTPERVLLDVEVANKRELFDLLATHFSSQLETPAKTIALSLDEREGLGSTGLGHGVAIPHGRIKGLRDPAAAAVVLKTPIDFGAPDGAAVKLVIALLVPHKATDLHLQLLSELANLLSRKSLRDALLGSSAPEQVYRLLTQDSR